METLLKDASPATAWSWGDYLLLPAHRRLLRHGEPVDIEDRALDLIVLLLQHRERALDRQEVITEIWGKRPVSDATLRQLVYKARRAVGDDGEQQAVICTLYGRSLQWVAPVEAVESGESRLSRPLIRASDPETEGAAADPTPAARPESARPSLLARPRPLWTAAALVVLFALLVVFARQAGAPPAPALPRLAIEPMDNATGDKSLDWVSDGFPGLLGGLLEQSGGLNVVDSAQVAHAWKFTPTQGRDHEQQLRFVTGADALVGGRLRKLTDSLYELSLRVVPGDGAPVEFTLTGGKPGLLAADAVPRIRRALRLNRPAVPSRLPKDAFLAEAYARGSDLAVHGTWKDAREYFRLCVKVAPDFLPGMYSLGVAQFETNDVSGGEHTLQEVASRAGRQGDAHMRTLALYQLGHLARSYDDEPRALEYLRQAVGLAQREGDARTEIATRALLADVLHKVQKPVESRRELQAAEALSRKHPELVSARALLYDMQGSIAGDEGNQQGAVAAARAALELRQSLGDERGTVVSMFNLALPLRALHKDVESLAVSAHCYQQAITGNALGMQFACGANIAASLLDLGLSRSAIAMTGRLMSLAPRTGSAEYGVLALQLRSLGEMQEGDFRSALADLRKGDTLADVSKLEYATFLDQEIYEAAATFMAAPRDMAALSKRFDALATTHMKDAGYPQRRSMLRALAAAANQRPSDALASLREATSVPPLAGDGDFEIRMAPLLIALAGHDQAAAGIALKNYDPATTNDAGVLRLYAQWTLQQGDQPAARRAQARLAQLRKQGQDALAAAGMDTVLAAN